MEMWHILVLSAVRLGLDANYDRLEDFANHHKLIRQILGVETASTNLVRSIKQHDLVCCNGKCVI
ncbi:MAG: hypothetical protein Q7J76_09205 [Candidatus Brocadiaceae bacterium]|nr:hypothetical protein [Candidatus Brocadiaceae bacterium]